jgi:hypothetical protein
MGEQFVSGWRRKRTVTAALLFCEVAIVLHSSSTAWAAGPNDPILAPQFSDADLPPWGLPVDVFRERTRGPLVRHPSFQLKVPRFLHTHPDDPDRHIGKGQPLQGTSWLNRPYHVDWLFGTRLSAGQITSGIQQDDSIYGGYRLGRDFDHYWGQEIQFSFTQSSLSTSDGSVAINRDWGLDASLLYYPWGDARWRPYVRGGMGVERMRFHTATGRGINELLFAMPVGVGVKYYVDRWLALRLDLTDHIAFGKGDIQTAHQMAMTFGVEVHFGGPRKKYR